MLILFGDASRAEITHFNFKKGKRKDFFDAWFFQFSFLAGFTLFLFLVDVF